MKEALVPIKPEVVVRVIECGPLRIGGHVRIQFSDPIGCRDLFCGQLNLHIHAERL